MMAEAAARRSELTVDIVAAVLFVAGSRLTPASPAKAIDLFFPRR